MKKLILGLDIGTSGCKALLLDNDGRIVSSAIAEYPAYSPKPGWSEQNPVDWWEGVKTAVVELGKSVSLDTVAAIGLSGQMHGMVALDEKNEVIRPAILWNDQRTAEQCEEITAAAGGLNGLLSYTNNKMLTGFTGGKILWMKKNEPENYAKTKIILNPKDYIRYMLTGDFATEVSDASGTGFFDVKNRRFSEKLLELLDISPSFFAKCFESCDITGVVSENAAMQTGLTAGIPVAGGGGDAVISTTGLGLAKPGRIGITLGTSGVVAMGLESFKNNPNGALQISCGNSFGSYHAMGVTLSAAGSYAWFQNTFGSSFKELDEMAEQIPAGADGLLFTPYLTGERCPVNDPDAKGTFTGITSRHGKGHFARAVMEGVAFSLKQVYDLINSPSDEIVLAGGGAKSALWRQIFADIFDLPVRTVYGSAEGGAFGAALVAGAAAGIWKNLRETVGFIKTESETLPIKENTEICTKVYERYCKVYDAMKECYSDL